MVKIYQPDECDCDNCEGEIPANEGEFGGSKCMCGCHFPELAKSSDVEMEYLQYNMSDPHPEFPYGTEVMVNMHHLDKGCEKYVKGKIVGKSMSYAIDYWMVDFGKVLFESYPYNVMNIPHIAICQRL